MVDALNASFRELRSALVAGAVWLLVIWVVARDHIDPQYSKSFVAASLHRLPKAIGPTGTLVVFLVFAVILGVISQQVFRAPTIWVTNGSVLIIFFFEWLVLAGKGLWGRMRGHQAPAPLRRYEGRELIAVDLARRIVEHHRSEIQQVAPPGKEAALEKAVYNEIETLKVRNKLDPTIPDSLIRALDSIAAIRMGVVIPLVAAGIVLAIQFLNPFWLVLSAGGIIIAFQASDYRHERDIHLENEIWPHVDLVAIAAQL